MKSEERIVHFLDFRETIHETQWDHGKPQECQKCDLEMVCGGIYEHDKYYNFVKVYPQIVSLEERKDILGKIEKKIS